jgi:hypothetical protein
MATQPRLTLMGGGVGGSSNIAGDTTYTKIFVGGLAWETQRDTMRRYFEQFGEILEAVVITDKNTGRSKGYGFVTFRDAESAFRALQDPTPVIDGRRANCNLAAFGAAQSQVPYAPQIGMMRFRPIASSIPSSVYPNSAAMGSYLQQPGQFPYPYYYGYSGGAYSQENMYPMSYYGALYSGSGGQQQAQVPAYYAPAGQGVYQNINPAYYSQLLQSNQAQSGYGLQYAATQMVYPYLPQQQQFGSGSLPTPVPSSTTGLLSNTGAAGIGSSSAHMNTDKRT